MAQLHDAYKRFSSKIEDGIPCKILYLGDHDPSGMDMIRDIRERISEMLNAKELSNMFDVEAIALTMEQIRRFEPPKNPAKLTDPRAKWYIKQFGYSSWEVDALDPKTLNSLLSQKIEENIDMELFNEILGDEEDDKNKLRKIKI